MAPFERVAEADRGLGNRLAAKLFFPLLAILVALFILFFVVYWTGEVSGDSMLPGLMDADLMLVTRGYDRPARGDVIIIDSDSYETTEEGIVKRVAAVAGDEITIVDSRAYVNGVLESGYEILVHSDARGRDINVEPYVVPDGYVYVLGDNRAVSLDSRALGPIPLEHVRGRAVAVFAPINRIGAID